MKIINAMFGKKLGGIEQAFLNYAESLAIKGHEVICLVHPKAKIIPKLQELIKEYPQKISCEKITNISKWDIFAKQRLNNLVAKEKPGAIIAHGSRAAILLRFAASNNKIPLIATVNNYWLDNIIDADYLFSISQDIINSLAGKFDERKIFKVPNSIRLIDEPAFRVRNNKPVIGVMARMVEKKGVNVFIKALSILDKRGIDFSAVIGGEGELLDKMQQLRDELKLNDKVRFTGWVKDKDKFYHDIDIFCLPSLSEPFGIVLLEAMQARRPIVSTNIEGPAEILHNNIDALMVDKANPEQMADALEDLIKNEGKAKSLTDAAYKNLKDNFGIGAIAEIINANLEKIIADYK